MKLAGKIAVVTGSSAGIGAALARGFAAAGADIVVNYCRDRAGAEATAQAIQTLGRTAEIVQADVGQAQGVERLFETVRQRWGRLDILVNNAGFSAMAPFDQHTEADWVRILDTNLRSVFLCAQAATALMDKGGAILNNSSIHAATTMRNCAIYAASKGGMEAFTRGLAVDLAPRGIRVNALRPGLIEVEREKLDHHSTQFADICRRIPMGRPGRPEDLVPLAVLLCSDDASFITGQVVAIDGGQGILLNTPYPEGFFPGGAIKDISN